VLIVAIVLIVANPFGSGPSKSDSPEDVANEILPMMGEVIEAAFAGDTDAVNGIIEDIKPYVCDDMESEMNSMTEEFDINAQMEEAGITDAPPIDIDLGFEYEVTGSSEDGDTATVDYSMTFNTPEPELGDDGMSITGWTVGEPTTEEDTMDLVKEDGAWVACDETA